MNTLSTDGRRTVKPFWPPMAAGIALGLALLFTGPGRISLDRALTSAGQERRVEKRVARRLGE